MGVVVLVQDTDSIADLASCLTEACQVRVAPFEAAGVWHGPICLDPAETVAGAGLTALQRVDLVPTRNGE
jgi:hypothetical protein